MERWLILAIVLHFSINAVVALLVLELQLSPWLGELVLVVMAAAVLTLGLRLASPARQPRRESSAVAWCC